MPFSSKDMKLAYEHKTPTRLSRHQLVQILEPKADLAIEIKKKKHKERNSTRVFSG